MKTRFRRGLLLALGSLVAGYSLFRLPSATASIRPDKPSAVPPAITAHLNALPPTDATPSLVPGPTPVAPLTTLDTHLQEYLSGQPGSWGLFVLDLTSGQTAGQEAQQMFPAASTIKLPLALYIYDQVRTGKATLDEPLPYYESDWQDGAGFLAWELSPGDTESVGHLIEIMIRYSDNVAKNILMRRFDQEEFFAWMRAHGGQVELRDDGDGGLIYTNAETLARMMRLLYNDQAFQNADLRRQLLDYLQTTVYTDRVAAGVPEGVEVAHKIGDLPSVVNDIALVWAPHGPFILAALSEGVDEQEGAEAISAITTESYQFLEQQHQTP